MLTFILLDMNALSMHSLVFNIDLSLGSNDSSLYDSNQKPIYLYQNPVTSQLKLSFPTSEKREISIFQLSGARVYHKKYEESKTYSIDVKSFAEGMYFLKSSTMKNDVNVKFLKINE